MTLLDIAGLYVLVFACLLYRFKKVIFDYDCYSIVYDTGSMLFHVFPPSFSPPIDHTTVISLVNVIGHGVAQDGTTLAIDTVRKTVEGICLVFTTNEDNTDTFKTNTA